MFICSSKRYNPLWVLPRILLIGYWGGGLSLRIKRSGREADDSPQSETEVKNWLGYTSTVTWTFTACTRTTLLSKLFISWMGCHGVSFSANFSHHVAKIMIDSSLIIHVIFRTFFRLILLWGYRSKTSTYFLLKFHRTNLIPLCCGTKFCTKFCTNDPNGNSGHNVKDKCMFLSSFLGCESCLRTLELELHSEDGSKELLRNFSINM